jgi:site-specific recombinase XerD
MINSVLPPFRAFLISKNYSSSTIRNYLSDIGNYFEFVSNPSVLRTAPLDKGASFTPALSREGVGEGFRLETVSAYLKTISSDPNYSRYLSSLSKFFQYALDQGLTKTNLLKSALRDKKPNLDEILNNYQDFLVKKNFSESTIKNYLNDIRQFTDWSSKSPDSPAAAGSSAPFDESGPEKKSFKFKFLIPLLSKGKAYRNSGTKEI